MPIQYINGLFTVGTIGLEQKRSFPKCLSKELNLSCLIYMRTLMQNCCKSQLLLQCSSSRTLVKSA